MEKKREYYQIIIFPESTLVFMSIKITSEQHSGWTFQEHSLPPANKQHTYQSINQCRWVYQSIHLPRLQHVFLFLKILFEVCSYHSYRFTEANDQPSILLLISTCVEIQRIKMYSVAINFPFKHYTYRKQRKHSSFDLIYSYKEDVWCHNKAILLKRI